MSQFIKEYGVVDNEIITDICETVIDDTVRHKTAPKCPRARSSATNLFRRNNVSLF